MKTYMFTGLDVAIQILRPNATYELSGLEITTWNDPRPKPSIEEILHMLEQIKKFEDQNEMEIVTETGDIEVVNTQEFLQGYFKKINT